MSPPERLLARLFPPLSEDQWRAGTYLFIGTLLAAWLSHSYIEFPYLLHPACALALAALYLRGNQLWPFAFVGVLSGAVAGGALPAEALVAAVACALQASVGAHILRTARIDPLFRHFRDSVWTLGTGVLVSGLSACTGVAVISARAYFGGDAYAGPPLIAWFVAELTAFLVIVPFLLRWVSKPRFARAQKEAAETLAVFAVLVLLSYILFIGGFVTLAGIPVRYFLLAPLFWIALRLRPRFVTLALVTIATLGTLGLFVGPDAGTIPFQTRLFDLQAYVATLATMFFLIVSLEEDRRLNRNLTRSQLATLENAVSRVSSESEAKNAFIAILAHELRNPLAPIANGIELLRLTGERTKEDVETLEMMEERMQAIKRLLDDLLDISRISEGKVSVAKEEVRLEQVLKRAVLSTQHYFDERHQHLEVKLPRAAVRVLGDALRLEQVFSNLLTNASKYTDSGGDVRLALKVVEGHAEVTVQDTGIGIAPENLANVFTAFHQVDGSGRGKSGLGIGLALVRSFTLMHGGTVRADSEGPGHGSCFTVSLPLLQPAQA